MKAKNMAQNFISNSKAKLGLAVTSVIVGSQASAAITYDAVTGFGGTMDTTAYNTAIPIVVGVIALVVATTIGIKALKGAKSA